MDAWHSLACTTTTHTNSGPHMNNMAILVGAQSGHHSDFSTLSSMRSDEDMTAAMHRRPLASTTAV